jgi:hypothetical protein
VDTGMKTMGFASGSTLGKRLVQRVGHKDNLFVSDNGRIVDNRIQFTSRLALFSAMENSKVSCRLSKTSAMKKSRHKLP